MVDDANEGVLEAAPHGTRGRRTGGNSSSKELEEFLKRVIDVFEPLR
jgi:hypothetical protein